jgi:hypothetical protein
VEEAEEAEEAEAEEEEKIRLKQYVSLCWAITFLSFKVGQ